MNIISNLNLVTEGEQETTIAWTSSKPEYIAADGTVTRPPEGAGDQNVTLTATISKGSATRKKYFYLTVKAETGPIVYYTVSFDSQGGSPVTSITDFRIKSWDSIPHAGNV